VIFEVPSNIIHVSRRGTAVDCPDWGFVGPHLNVHAFRPDTDVLFLLIAVAIRFGRMRLVPGHHPLLDLLVFCSPARSHHSLVHGCSTDPGLVGGPLSGWIMQSFSGVLGLHGRQWLFFIEGPPAVFIGIVIWFVLPFAFATGNMGISFWLPTFVQRAGNQRALSVGLLTAIPYACAAVAMIVLATNSDRTRERRWHLAIPVFVGALLLAACTLWSHDLTITIVVVTAASMCVFAVAPLLWSQPTALLSGAAAAAGIAMISSLGNLAGLFSPTLFGYLVLGGLLAPATPARLVNK
jgi:MFS family permease